MTIDENIMTILASNGSGVLTIGELAHQLGISPYSVLPAAHRLVADGRANPAFVQVHGVRTLRGLQIDPA